MSLMKKVLVGVATGPSAIAVAETDAFAGSTCNRVRHEGNLVEVSDDDDFSTLYQGRGANGSTINVQLQVWYRWR